MSYKLFFFACALNLFYYVPNLFASPIIGGYEDTDNTHKYHVSILVRQDPTNPNSVKLLCGGAIIDDRYVLTAARCFMLKTNGHVARVIQPRTSGVVVLAGTRRTYGPGIISAVRRIFIPHAYNERQERYGNIAIVQLAVDLNVAHNPDNLQILPLDRGHPLYFYENKNALVPGNGCDVLRREDDGLLRPQLHRNAAIRQVLEVYMFDRYRCPNLDHSICAEPLDRSHIRSCSNGDAGSPLVYRNTIIGVLTEATPFIEYNRNEMIFTRVWIFLKFIRHAMNEHGDHSQMYTLDQ